MTPHFWVHILNLLLCGFLNRWGLYESVSDRIFTKNTTNIFSILFGYLRMVDRLEKRAFSLCLICLYVKYSLAINIYNKLGII